MAGQNQNQPQPANIADDKAVSDIALALYTERSAKNFGRDQRAVATQCFRDAEAFFDVMRGYADGSVAVAAPVGPQLSDVSAPKLKPTHPHNLVSRKFGDLNKVAKVLAWLKANQDAESYEPYEWGPAEVKLARVLFPEFIVEDKAVAAAR